MYEVCAIRERLGCEITSRLSAPVDRKHPRDSQTSHLRNGHEIPKSSNCAREEIKRTWIHRLRHQAAREEDNGAVILANAIAEAWNANGTAGRRWNLN